MKNRKDICVTRYRTGRDDRGNYETYISYGRKMAKFFWPNHDGHDIIWEPVKNPKMEKLMLMLAGNVTVRSVPISHLMNCNLAMKCLHIKTKKGSNKG